MLCQRSALNHSSAMPPGQAAQGQFTRLMGSLPGMINGHITRAIGLSSGKPDEDFAVAQAGIDALNSALAVSS